MYKRKYLRLRKNIFSVRDPPPAIWHGANVQHIFQRRFGQQTSKKLKKEEDKKDEEKQRKKSIPMEMKVNCPLLPTFLNFFLLSRRWKERKVARNKAVRPISKKKKKRKV